LVSFDGQGANRDDPGLAGRHTNLLRKFQFTLSVFGLSAVDEANAQGILKRYELNSCIEKRALVTGGEQNFSLVLCARHRFVSLEKDCDNDEVGRCEKKQVDA